MSIYYRRPNIVYMSPENVIKQHEYLRRNICKYFGYYKDDDEDNEDNENNEDNEENEVDEGDEDHEDEENGEDNEKDEDCEDSEEVEENEDSEEDEEDEEQEQAPQMLDTLEPAPNHITEEPDNKTENEATNDNDSEASDGTSSETSDETDDESGDETYKEVDNNTDDLQTSVPLPEESSCHECTRFDSWDAVIACSRIHDGVERWFHLKCVDLSTDTMPKEEEEWFCGECKAQSDEESRPESDKESHHHDEKTEDGVEHDSSTDQNDKKRKRAQSAPKTTSGATKQPKRKSEPWTQHEKDLIATLMQQIIDEQKVNLGEKKWDAISERLRDQYHVARSSTAVKNYWNREGRQHTGIDERRKPNPKKMVTGVQNPEDRRRARQEAKKAEGGRKVKGEEDEEEEENSDDNDEDKPKIKRRKRN